MKYFANTPWWLKKVYPSRLWDYHSHSAEVFLTFDDGPHPVATPFVLDLLKKYNAKATFFCIGKNVDQYRGVYQRILDEGHQTGNHTNTHPNGWKLSRENYFKDVSDAAVSIHSNLFRPPYGRLRSSQARDIKRVLGEQVQIVMWSVLSGDFDSTISPEICYNNVVDNIRNGSIVVFHDSEKSFPKLKLVLPRVLETLAERGFSFGKIKAGKLN